MPSSLRISEASTTDLVHFESFRIDDEMLEFEEVQDASGVAAIAAELAENRRGDLLHRVEIVEHLCGHVDRYRGTRRQRLRIQLSHFFIPHTIPPGAGPRQAPGPTFCSVPHQAHAVKVQAT